VKNIAIQKVKGHCRKVLTNGRIVRKSHFFFKSFEVINPCQAGLAGKTLASSLRRHL
jgi:hypothetical protein